MIAVYAIFFAEVAAFRIGNKKMEKLGITYNTHADAEAAHGHDHEHPAEGSAGVTPVGSAEESTTAGQKQKMAEAGYDSSSDASSDVARVDYDISTSEGVAQLIAVGVLEFGVILHSIIIGLTLSVSDEFITLFIVIIFHRESQEIQKPVWSIRVWSLTMTPHSVYRNVRGSRFRIPSVATPTTQQASIRSLRRCPLVLDHDVSHSDVVSWS